MATQTTRQSAVLKYEADCGYSRKNITVITGQNLVAGTVLGKITASGKYTAWTTGAADGSEVAAAVLLEAVNATAADKAGVAIARHAIVAAGNLVYAGSPNDAQKTAARASLEAAGIVSRTAV